MSEDQNTTTSLCGVGLDMGTMNIVAARREDNVGVVTNRIRDAFLDLPAEHKRMLKLSSVNYVEKNDSIIIVGDAAYEMANVFGREVRRPLASGLISAGEMDALEILGILVRHVLGDPKTEKEICVFSVPAAPVDEDRDIVYHKGILEKIVTECGYTAIPSNEALAIIYAECGKDQFSGVGISYGCLTPETPIFTENGWVPISFVREGDRVLRKDGRYGRVTKTWTRLHEGEIYKLSFYGNPRGVELTGNHRVWVQRDGEWDWVPAEEMKVGDIIGEPVVAGYGARKCLSIREKDRNGPTKQKILDWSGDLGRFLGYFLADGSLQSSDKNREGRYEIHVDFGPEEHLYVEDLGTLVESLFDRQMQVRDVENENGTKKRCSFSHGGLHGWLKANCYLDTDRHTTDPNVLRHGDKRFPLCVQELRPSVVEGIVVGLVRGDGWTTVDGVKFGNSSVSLITTFHLLVGRMGLTSTITRRDPRDATLKNGRVIHGTRDEWTVHITGWDGQYLKQILVEPSNQRSPRIWKDGGFRCTKVREIEVVDYEGPVHDLTVEGDPSFCAPYITLHNSGMTNVALAIRTVEALSFSVARGGDWLDQGAAKSVGATQARMCSIKEKGLNLMSPEGREQEALVVYYKNLIEYTIENLAKEFDRIRSQFDMPFPIPIVVSGGTSKADGFLEFFKEVFETKRKRFPIEVSQIRAATEPLDAVARGLLVQAVQEYDD